MHIFAIVALLAGATWAFRRGWNSAREDVFDTALNTDLVTLPDAIMSSLNWTYFYGSGSPSTPWSEGGAGVDCSGYAQMVLVKLGKLLSTATDRGALDLANASNPVAVGSQTVGDMAYYPGHVVIVASEPGKDGHSMVIGARGNPWDFGNNPDSKVKLYSSALYRSDFSTYMRLKSNA